ncbi:MAG: hypothetical protein AB7U63_11800 [Porticoccaceae bacterium]
MDIRPKFQIQVMIKAMEDVVIPAVDATEPMALEQAKLVLSSLRVLKDRLPLWYRYNRDELRRYLDLSRSLLAVIPSSDDTGKELADVLAYGNRILEQAGTEPKELEDAIAACRSSIVKIMDAMEQNGVSLIHSEVGRLVLSASQTQLDRERAWLIPFGFESDPSTIKAIEDQLS